MKQAKLQAAILGGTPDDIEAAFYEALHKADIEQMMSCWAEDDDVMCVHPGGGRIIGTSAIRSVFKAMFSNGAVQAEPERVHKIQSLASAVHHLIEKVSINTSEGRGSVFVIASNVYHKTPQGWRMVAHHASPGTPYDPNDVDASSRIFH